MYFISLAVTTALIGLTYGQLYSGVAEAQYGVTEEECQKIHFVYSEFGCHKVFAPVQPLTWAQARKMCQKLKTDLAVLESEDELVYLADIMNKRNSMTYAWLGVHAKNGEWMTVHGRSINQTGFNPWKNQHWNYWRPRESDCTILVNILSLGQSMTRQLCDLTVKGYICQKR